MTETERYLAVCCAAAISGKKCGEFPVWVDAEQFYDSALSQGVAGAVCYAVLGAAGVPEQLASKLESAHADAAERDRAREEEEKRVFAALDKADVSYLPLQGSVLRLYYPEHDMRCLSDTDLAIEGFARKDARAALKSCGYAFSASEGGRDVYKNEKGLVFVLHYRAEDKSVFHQKLMERALPVGEEGTRLSLSHSDFYIYMISNLARHMRRASAKLKFFADIKVFYSRCGDKLDGEYVDGALASMGLDYFEKAVKQAIYALFYGADPNDETEELIDYVFSCGGTDGAKRGKYKGLIKRLGLANTKNGRAKMSGRDLALSLVVITVLISAIYFIGITFFKEEKPRAYLETDESEESVAVSTDDEESHFAPPEQNYATIPYKSGVYKGYISNGLPNGTGELDLPNGEKYIGSFADGEFNGPGIYRYLDGSTYDGMWFEGTIHGYGTLTFADNSYIYANFVDGEPQGSCIYQNAEGDVYEGELKDGKRTGNGRFLWTNGDRYEGNYVDGEREGQGKYTYANGNSYEGEWIASVPNGKGVMIVDGVKYEGIFVQGLIEGEGVSTSKSGDVYTGFFVGGKCEDDNAVYTFKDGSKYEGAFKDDLFNGKGKFTYPDGDTVQGTFENGVLQGTAVYFDKSTGISRYVTYKDGKPA